MSMPASMSMRPAPIVSGSSVTSGRCWANAVVRQSSNTSTATASRIEVINSLIPVDGCRRLVGTAYRRGSELSPAIQQKSDWSIVHERDLHRCLKLAGADIQPVRSQLAYDIFVEGTRNRRRRGV